MDGARWAAAVLALAACAACSAKYKTGPDGLPVGSPDVTYYGPGAGLGGTQISGPGAPPPALPPPSNLTAPVP